MIERFVELRNKKKHAVDKKRRYMSKKQVED